MPSLEILHYGLAARIKTHVILPPCEDLRPASAGEPPAVLSLQEATVSDSGKWVQGFRVWELPGSGVFGVCLEKGSRHGIVTCPVVESLHSRKPPLRMMTLGETDAGWLRRAC